MEYVREKIKRLEIQVELHKRAREVGLAEEALRASFAAEVSALTTLRPWRVSAMHDALRLLREEHELQADVTWNMDEKVALFESRERARGERESERTQQ